jgi:L-glutamine-phosphate cytidylyltransferase
MRAVILAAGRGSRLTGHTEDRPKCLVEVDGRSLLDRQVAALRGGGATEVAVVVGWRRDAFTRTDLGRFVNEDWASTTMVDTLACAAPWLETGPVVVSYGDIVYSAATVAALAAADGDAPIAVGYDPDWLALWTERFADPLDDAETFALDAAGRIADIGGRPGCAAEVQGQYLGLLRITPAGWRELCRARAAADRADLTGLLRQVLRDGRMPLAAVPVVGPWYEFDHPSDLDTGRRVVRRLDAMHGW